MFIGGIGLNNKSPKMSQLIMNVVILIKSDTYDVFNLRTLSFLKKGDKYLQNNFYCCVITQPKNFVVL